MARQKQNWVKSMSTAVNLGTSVAAAIALGLFGGKWLDNRFDTDYLFTLLGILLGTLTAGKMMWDKLTQDSRKKSNLKQNEKNSQNNENNQ